MLRVILLPYIVLEVLLIMLFIGSYGFLLYLLEVILSAVVGAILLFKFNISNVFGRLNSFSVKAIYSGFGTAFGAFLLFLPGILSDIVAIFIIIFSLIFTIKEGKNTKFSQNQTKNADDIIDVEIIEEEKYERKDG